MTSSPTLACTTVGSGPPLVTLHASGMNGRQFARFAKEASARFTVHSPDLLGVGATPMPAGPFNLAREVDAVVAFLEALPAPALLLGHSWGGLVAMEAAMRVPARVRALCLYEPVIVHLAADVGSAEARAELVPIRTLLTMPVDADGGRAWVEQFVDWWNGAGFFARMSPQQQQLQVDVALECRRQAGCTGQSTLTLDNLRALTAETLFMIGQTSPASARESVWLAAKAMPRARVEVVAGAGHMGPLTHGAVVNPAALAFFDGVTAP